MQTWEALLHSLLLGSTCNVSRVSVWSIQALCIVFWTDGHFKACLTSCCFKTVSMTNLSHLFVLLLILFLLRYMIANRLIRWPSQFTWSYLCWCHAINGDVNAHRYIYLTEHCPLICLQDLQFLCNFVVHHCLTIVHFSFVTDVKSVNLHMYFYCICSSMPIGVLMEIQQSKQRCSPPKLLKCSRML